MTIKLTIHPSVRDIILEYGGTPSDTNLINGQIAKNNCWGFISDLNHVHIYYNNASKADLVDLMAHEISHSKYNDIKENILDEEQLCTLTAKIALEAYDWMTKISQ